MKKKVSVVVVNHVVLFALSNPFLLPSFLPACLPSFLHSSLASFLPSSLLPALFLPLFSLFLPLLFLFCFPPHSLFLLLLLLIYHSFLPSHPSIHLFLLLLLLPPFVNITLTCIHTVFTGQCTQASLPALHPLNNQIPSWCSLCRSYYSLHYTPFLYRPCTVLASLLIFPLFPLHSCSICLRHFLSPSLSLSFCLSLLSSLIIFSPTSLVFLHPSFITSHSYLLLFISLQPPLTSTFHICPDTISAFTPIPPLTSTLKLPPSPSTTHTSPPVLIFLHPYLSPRPLFFSSPKSSFLPPRLPISEIFTTHTRELCN